MNYQDELGNWEEIILEPSGDTLPVGSIAQFGGENAPTNWLICNGQGVSRTEYAELFSVIGTIFGEGDGSTTFNVPDFSSRTPMGLGQGTDSNGVQSTTYLGQTYGEYAHTLTVDEIPSHSHNASLNSPTTTDFSGQDNWAVKYSEGAHNPSYVDATGGGQAHGNVQPILGVNFIIKAKQSIGIVGSVVTDITSTSSDAVPTAKTVKDYVDNAEEYSETEVKTNKVWINGKPIYRKVIVKNMALTNSVNNNVEHNVSNLGTITHFAGGVEGNRYIPSANANAVVSLFSYDTTYLKIAANDTWSARDWFFIIEYTKTTD